MSGWSKDPETGMPKFVSEADSEFVSLVTTEEAQSEENREKGVKTPGWVDYRQHTRADGHIKRRVNTLVSFKHVPTPEEPEEPEVPENP